MCQAHKVKQKTWKDRIFSTIMMPNRKVNMSFVLKILTLQLLPPCPSSLPVPLA